MNICYFCKKRKADVKNIDLSLCRLTSKDKDKDKVVNGFYENVCNECAELIYANFNTAFKTLLTHNYFFIHPVSPKIVMVDHNEKE